MVRRKRADKEKSSDIIAAYFAKNPYATVRQAEKDLWICKSTVAEHRKDLDNVGQKDERILYLTDRDMEIIMLWQDLIKEKLQDKNLIKRMNIRDISTVTKDSSTRYSLFRWEATDKDWGMKEIKITLPSTE